MNGKNKARAGGRGRRILLWALALAVLLVPIFYGRVRAGRTNG